MRISIISDIHSNYEALINLSDILTDVDQIICLGDLIGYYCQVNEVIEFVRSMDALCIMGNHESYLLYGFPNLVDPAVRFGIEYADRVIYKQHRQWLANLPLLWGGQIDETSLLLCHGSPFQPLSDYLYSDSINLDKLYSFDFDIIAIGQTHHPMIQSNQRPFLINPGSVGQSRHSRNLACAIILDTQSKNLSLIERPYDSSRVIEMAKRNGAGDFIYKHIGNKSNDNSRKQI